MLNDNTCIKLFFYSTKILLIKTGYFSYKQNNVYSIENIFIASF